MGGFCPDPAAAVELRWEDHQGDEDKTNVY